MTPWEQLAGRVLARYTDSDTEVRKLLSRLTERPVFLVAQKQYLRDHDEHAAEKAIKAEIREVLHDMANAKMKGI